MAAFHASFICCFAIATFTAIAREMTFPPAISVQDGDTLRMKSIYFPHEIFDDSAGNKRMKTLARLTGRAYCVNDICSIPAPTLIVYPGITIHIELENAFDVDYVDEADLMGPEVTNIHSHGLHISGIEDDVFTSIQPGDSKSITWTIHPQHHLGTNWYHAHHHGSTALHVINGMYGALIVDTEENSDLDYNRPHEIHDYVIEISWQFLHDVQYCNNCTAVNSVDAVAAGYGYVDSFKFITSLCSKWCGYSDEQRANSGWLYDVVLDGSENNDAVIQPEVQVPALEVFLVNNLYQPTISTLRVDEYFKLRIIATTAAMYTQFQFDYNEETDCEYSLIARDGVAVQDVQRDLSMAPYFGMFLLPPGGRMDVLVMCKGEGVAEIYHNEVHPHYRNVNVSYPMGRITRQKLFSLQIKEKQKSSKSAKSDGNHKHSSHAHLLYPEPVTEYPYYIEELLDSTNSEVETECKCSSYDRANTEDVIVRESNRCAVEFIEGAFNSSGKGLSDMFEVNGERFDAEMDALFLISLNEMYEFYVNSDGHPMHIHINPFMVMQDLLHGYVAKQYDVMDTLGYNHINDSAEAAAGSHPEREAFLIRINPTDYVGNVILHCHFLGHEDLGMMAFLKIVDGATDDPSVCDSEYGYHRLVADQGNNGGDATMQYAAGLLHDHALSVADADRHDHDDALFQFVNHVLFVLIVLAAMLNCIVCCAKFAAQNKSRYYY